VLLAAACAGFSLLRRLRGGLLLLTALLGVSHLFIMASQQMLCIRCAGPRGRDRVFGNYMVASAIGQGLGPYFYRLVERYRDAAADRPAVQHRVDRRLASLFTAAAIRPAPAPAEHVHRKGGGAGADAAAPARPDGGADRERPSPSPHRIC